MSSLRPQALLAAAVLGLAACGGGGGDESGSGPSPYANTYTIMLGAAPVTFIVDDKGNIQCANGIACTGKVDDSGKLTLSGNDGDGTTATLTGTIGTNGKVTGNYSGISDGESISGSFTGGSGSSSGGSPGGGSGGSTSPYAGTYAISGGDVTMTFSVDNNGNISQCSNGLITCTGKVGGSGNLTLSGSDGDGTTATLTGTIGTNGNVTGNFSGVSDGEAIKGSFTGNRTSNAGGGTPGITPSVCPSLTGIWTNAAILTSWTFSGDTATQVTRSSNLNNSATQTTVLQVLSCTSSAFTAKYLRFKLDNPADRSLDYDYTPSNNPKGFDFSKQAVQPYSLNGAHLKLGNYTYEKQ